MAVTDGEQMGRAIRLEYARERGQNSRAKKAVLAVRKARGSAKNALAKMEHKVKVLTCKERNVVADVSFFSAENMTTMNVADFSGS